MSAKQPIVLIHNYDECLCHDTEIAEARRTTEMRVIVRFEGSDGSVWECNKVIKCRLKRTKPPGASPTTKTL